MGVKFADLDARMRALEKQGDASLPLEGFLIARLDGRGFTRLTKELLTLQKPFDERFHHAMSRTLEHLFGCGFTVRLGYSQSDEISLLFEPDGVPFERKTRKILSILAGEASAAFSVALGARGAFDCRVVVLPDENLVRDYFLWRGLDAARNALSAHCYWVARAGGDTPREATRRFQSASSRDKRAFLAENGVDFDALARWQTRGFAAFWQSFENASFNPKTGESVSARRKKLVLDLELPSGEPSGDEFALYLTEKLRV